MLNSEKEFLQLFGWTDFFESQWSDLRWAFDTSSSLFPARIVCEERNLYRVQAGFNQIFWASVSGKMQFIANARLDYPAVGDWVVVELAPQSDRGVIHHVFERKTVISRKQIGSGSDLQILSTNVDYTFITTSINLELNYRRIDRYLAVAYQSKTRPVILLTKADTCFENLEVTIAAVAAEFPHVPIHALSKENFHEADFLEKYLQKGTTSIVIGSSGVGKSTLVNFLIGREEIKTQAAREDDDRGRHTTTSRNLYVSRYGGLVIDTPGMRELQLSEHGKGLESQFSDIEQLMQQCRFSDCAHETEPDCVIQKALAQNTLSEARWRSFRKLQAEVRHALRKQDKAVASEDRKIWKQRNIQARARDRHKKRGH